MIRSLFFFVKLGLLAAIVVWVAENPGSISIEWMSYKVTAHVGLFFLAFAVVIGVCFIVARIYRAITHIPSRFRKTGNVKGYEKGLKAITAGLSAVAAGDIKRAQIQSKKAQKLLPADQGVTLLLQAQVARMNGDEKSEKKALTQLMQDKDAGFLGVRGLLQSAIKDGKTSQVKILTEQALEKYPKNPWLLQMAYEVLLNEKNWPGALDKLDRLEKYKILPAKKIRSDRVALMIACADDNIGRDKIKMLQKAYKINPVFVPLVRRLATHYMLNGARKKAVSIVKKTWEQNPVPELALQWGMLYDEGNNPKPLARMKWFETLLKVNPDAPETYIALGKATMEEGLWGEARDYLLKAEILAGDEAPQRLYALLAELERKQDNDEAAAQEWLLKGRSHKAEKQWICNETGRVYSEWMPLAAPHNIFNSIEWMSPDSIKFGAALAHGQDKALDLLAS